MSFKLLQLCDIIRQSAEGHRPRVFVVEILGGFSGYLTSMTGIYVIILYKIYILQI